MKKKRKFKGQSTSDGPNNLQIAVMLNDVRLFVEHQELVEFIRRYVPGEFNNLSEEQLQEVKWVRVTRENNLSIRRPLSAKEFLEFTESAENEPPKVGKNKMEMFVLKTRRIS